MGRQQEEALQLWMESATNHEMRHKKVLVPREDKNAALMASNLGPVEGVLEFFVVSGKLGGGWTTQKDQQTLQAGSVDGGKALNSSDKGRRTTRTTVLPSCCCLVTSSSPCPRSLRESMRKLPRGEEFTIRDFSKPHFSQGGTPVTHGMFMARL